LSIALALAFASAITTLYLIDRNGDYLLRLSSESKSQQLEQAQYHQYL